MQYPVKLALKYVGQNKDLVLQNIENVATHKYFWKKDNPIKEITKPMNKRYKKMVKEITKS